MYLTTENAQQYLGKTIDSCKRLFGDYPYLVCKRDNGEYYYKGACGVCIAVPLPNDRFNQVYFDFVVEEMKE